MKRPAYIPVIRVGDSVCKVEGARELFHEIDDKLAVEVKGAYYAKQNRPGWDGKWHPFDLLRGTFPTGLLRRVRRAIPTAQVIDKRVKPPQYDLNPDILKGITLTEYQLAGVIGILEEGRGVVGIGTGGGKTEVGIAVGMHVPGKCVFIVHRRDALAQTVERIKLRTGDDAARIGDGMWEDRAANDDTKFVVAMPQTAGLDLKLFRAQCGDASVIVLDEVHRTGGAASWYKVSQYIPAYYRVGLTGTPETGDAVKDRRLEASTGPVLLRVRASDLADAGILVHARVIFHRVSNMPVPGDYMTARRALIEDNEKRNNLIVQLASDATRNGERVLIICDTKRHERRIAEVLRGTGLRCTVLHGGHATGLRMQAKRELRAGVLEVVLCTPIWDDSIDLPELDTVILAAGGRSGLRVLQRIGRALRKSPGKEKATIHDFYDTGNRIMESHSIARQRACKKEGFEIVKGEPR